MEKQNVRSAARTLSLPSNTKCADSPDSNAISKIVVPICPRVHSHLVTRTSSVPRSIAVSAGICSVQPVTSSSMSLYHSRSLVFHAAPPVQRRGREGKSSETGETGGGEVRLGRRESLLAAERKRQRATHPCQAQRGRTPRRGCRPARTAPQRPALQAPARRREATSGRTCPVASSAKMSKMSKNAEHVKNNSVRIYLR